jgi:hypothetical protein
VQLQKYSSAYRVNDGDPLTALERKVMSSVLCSKGCTYTDVAVHIYIAEALLTDSELELFQTLVGKGVRVYDSPTKPLTTPTKDITAAVVNATSSSSSSSGIKVPRDKSREYRLTFVVSSMSCTCTTSFILCIIYSVLVVTDSFVRVNNSLHVYAVAYNTCVIVLL